MKIRNILLGAAAATGIVFAFTASASAYVVCNAGDCWYSQSRLRATPGVTFEYHPDDWYFHQHWDADRHWHDIHEGRGYWKGGVWIGL